MNSKISFLLLLLLFSFSSFAQTTIYESETLKIEQISPNTFVHISYLNTEDFGKVGCNGMIVINEGEALVFDTPANDEASLELLNWLENDQKTKVKGVVATHFHWDCLGGLNEFHAKAIPSYASSMTIELAKAAGYPVPENGFKKRLVLKAGNIDVINQFLGEGHTKDNFVAYVSSDKVIFGGCMIKELGAGNGNLEDANVAAWPTTVRNVKSTFPETSIVIPGHGKIGGTELLDYTIEMFEKQSQ
ncbi:subclass B1 metallo-beta-lactamase [Algoriphagus sp. D3-2-R+10]|uniref:subclass B1 metallo-beta-lactamase n=1 Tax=Algoriphagus aurantiacus TaxID=3103948 RepID=UPI002B3C4592|nr:subclass B1 metallo-beta-lactamase [Algoriphagus sp. D3-2-R+10]MEB2774447.1 subclass B1 metallo-beta-lactamase [Algoriphagus sp. D3-2-R+10]